MQSETDSTDREINHLSSSSLSLSLLSYPSIEDIDFDMDTTEYEVYRDYVDEEVDTNTDDELNNENEKSKSKDNGEDNLKVKETRKDREKDKNKRSKEIDFSSPIGFINAKNIDSMKDPESVIFDHKNKIQHKVSNFVKNVDENNDFQNENENSPFRVIDGIESLKSQKNFSQKHDDDEENYKMTERVEMRVVERDNEIEEEKNINMETKEKEGEIEREREKDKLKMKEKSRQPVSFPLRLFDVVDEEDPNVIDWRDMGTSFRIFDVANFVTNILFRRFKCKYLL